VRRSESSARATLCLRRLDRLKLENIHRSIHSDSIRSSSSSSTSTSTTTPNKSNSKNGLAALQDDASLPTSVATATATSNATSTARTAPNHQSRFLSASFSSSPLPLTRTLAFGSGDAMNNLSSSLHPPQQRHLHQRQHAVQSLVDTLLTSQMLLPRSTGTLSCTTKDQDPPWLRFFADLGSSSAVMVGEEASVDVDVNPSGTNTNTDTTASPASAWQRPTPASTGTGIHQQPVATTYQQQKQMQQQQQQPFPIPQAAPVLGNLGTDVADDVNANVNVTANVTATATSVVETDNDKDVDVDQQPQNTPRAASNAADPADPNIKRMERQLTKFILQKNPQRAMDTFHLGLRYETADQLQPDTVRQLFFLVARKRPFDAYKVLQHYRKITAEEHDQDVNAYAGMYERNCDALRYIDPEKHRYNDIHKLVRSLVMELQQLDRVGKEQCYPVLVSALVSQKSVSVGDFARLAYQYMVQNNFAVEANYWEHLLSLSRYFRQKDLPYASILRRIVDMGRRPDPVTALNALENLFPYTDVDATYTALKAIVDLQSTAQPGDEFQYVVDISALEVIGAAAARTGHFVLSLLIWDLVDLLGYKPTEAIFENTIMAFAVEPNTYGNAFTVMAEMEANGYEPSRALIRGFSAHLR
jgi:hypothetical protein